VAEEWIVVRNWERFQHPDAARSQVPPWIKVYTELLSDPAFLGLSLRRRGILVCIWIEYARSRRRLPANTRHLYQQLASNTATDPSASPTDRITARDLEALNHAGFIEFSASKPASNSASKVASLEKRREETPISPEPSLADSLASPASGPANLPPRHTIRQGARNPNATQVTAYVAAEAMTRNIGWQMPLPSFQDELARFHLDDAERDLVVALWRTLTDEELF